MELAHANHDREYLDGSFASKPSCIKEVPASRLHQGFQHKRGFIITLRCKPLNAQRNRPDIAIWRMRAADSTGVFSGIEKWICMRKACLPRTQIYRIMNGTDTQIGERQQAGNICVIHKKLMSQSIHFIGINQSKLRVIYGAILHNTLQDIIAELGCSLR